MRGAIPVLSRALRADDAHPSVGLLGGATVLALKLVAAGRIRVSESGDSWEAGRCTSDDTDCRTPAGAGACLRRCRRGEAEDPDPGAARRRGRHDDPHPAAGAAAAPAGPARAGRGRRRPARRGGAQPAGRGARRAARRRRAPVVLQVHDRDDPATSPTPPRCGRAPATASAPGAAQRRHRAAPGGRRLAGARPAARAAGARPDHARRRRARRPARGRRRALCARGVDVLLAARPAAASCEPRAGRGRRGCARASPLMTGLFGPEALFAFDWRLALHGDPLTEEEMDAAGRRRPRRSSGCATTGWSSTRRSPARPASGWSAPVTPVAGARGRAHRHASSVDGEQPVEVHRRAPACSRSASGCVDAADRRAARRRRRAARRRCATTSATG